MARARSRSSPRKKTWQVPALIVALGLIGLVFVFAGGDNGQDAQNVAANGDTASATPALNPLERRDPDDPLTMGAADAPIVLVVFSDYKCGFCASWVDQTLPTMVEYVDAGQMRIEWRDVNILSELSEQAAYAAYAAGLQDRFWDYHAALYPNGEPRPDDLLSNEALAGLAEELGLDTAQFADDFTSPALRDAVNATALEGQQSGVSSTPSFLLDGNPIVGAQPTNVFVDAVEQALAAHGL